jgi:outer membrane protein OmpA-like peptidoglycan-associated protein
VLPVRRGLRLFAIRRALLPMTRRRAVPLCALRALPLLALSALSLPLQAARAEPVKKPLLAVLEFATKLDAAAQAEADPQYFSDVVRGQALDELPDARLMTRENMTVLLQATGKDLAACEGECDVDTGRKLGADYVISGELLKVGSSYKLDLKLHATADGQLLSGALASGKSIDELDAALPATVTKLLAPLKAPPAKAPVVAAPSVAAPPSVDTKSAAAPAQVAGLSPSPRQGSASPPAAVLAARAARSGAGSSQPAPVAGQYPAAGQAQYPAANQAQVASATASQPAAAPLGQPAPGARARLASAAPAANRFQYISVAPDRILHRQGFFAEGSVVVARESLPMAREAALAIDGPPARNALVICRTESDRTTPAQLRAARQRAFALKHSLVEGGVPANRVAAEWTTPRRQALRARHALKELHACEILLR